MTQELARQEANSLAVSVALQPQNEIETAIAALTDEQISELLYDWSFWARPDQMPPDGDWFGWLLRSGRGAGKTRTGAEWVISRAKIKGHPPIALVGQTKADVRDTMIEVGESSILKISPPWFMPTYEPSKRRLTWPNGVIATVFSGDEPDQLRGPQHGAAWVDELAKFKYPQETWDNLELGLRLGDTPQVVVTTTPRPIPIIKQLLSDPQVIDRVVSTFANVHNLSSRFIERVVKRYEGTRLGQQELYGAILDDVPGALWTRDTLEKYRVSKIPRTLSRIVVGVDPAASNSEQAAETGIVVCGYDSVNNHGYTLDDTTIRGSAAERGKAIVATYHKWEADLIVAEVNNGGDMVAHMIWMADGGKGVPVKQVRASRGKYTRAEPVSSLFEQGRCHQVGYFPDLEDQLCEWLPEDDSPDRLDAMVWAYTELMVDGRRPVEIIDYAPTSSRRKRRR